MIPRPAILAEARAWLGTPYQHQASVRHVGCDCAGLVRGVWRALVGPEPEPMPAYTPGWAERGAPEHLEQFAQRWLRPTNAVALPGDVLLFGMAATAPLKHCAILSDRDSLLHAYWGRAVVESRFSPWWRARLGRAFAFPGAGPWPT